MKFKIAIVFALLATPAFAQQKPVPPITIPGQLADAIYQHLTIGGTHSAGAELARELIDAARAPQIEAAKEDEMRKKIEAEKKPSEPAKTDDNGR